MEVLCDHLGVLPQCLHRSLPAQGTEVRSHISCCPVGQLCQIYTGADRHLLTEDRQDGFSLLQGGRSDDNLRRRWESQRSVCEEDL